MAIGPLPRAPYVHPGHISDELVPVRPPNLEREVEPFAIYVNIVINGEHGFGYRILKGLKSSVDA
eukprot:scaffold1190_cov393-Prasinococcus_capsulatus_cf.AAC.26